MANQEEALDSNRWPLKNVLGAQSRASEEDILLALLKYAHFFSVKGFGFYDNLS